MYRPELNKITGSIAGTILLQQICYWFDKRGGKPFYKFKEPCSHDAYKEGDSWCEELGITREIFDSAIGKIGFKKGTPPKYQEIKSENEAIVIYWTDSQRLTWYTVNPALLGKALNTVYLLYTEITTEITNESKVETDETPTTNDNITAYRELKDRGKERKGRKLNDYKPFTPSWKKEEKGAEIPGDIMRMLNFVWKGGTKDDGG